MYITSRGKGLNLQLLENVARWTGQMLHMFGLGEGSPEELGWGADGSSAGGVNVRFSTFISILSPVLIGQ